mgnify:CR=1 FL=1
MIIPVYQPLGSSTHKLAQKVGERTNTKATHTGTLDPMAEGVVIVLTEEDRFQKGNLSSWKKTYDFQIIWGISTDTHDLLGVIDQISYTQDIHFSKLYQYQTAFIGKQSQKIPHFSAKRKTEEQYSDITIFDLVHTQTNLLPIQTVLNQINKVIPKLTNDFRQGMISDQWNTFISSLPQKEETLFIITSHTAITSKRTYIRQLVQDLSLKMNIPATTFHINRTANGPYTTKDCICLI